MFFLFSDSRFVIRAIYLPSLFQPLPKWWTITQSHSDWKIIFRMQTLLDLFTSRVHPPWTLSGLCYDGKHRMGILNTRQGEVCMVAPPLLDVHDYFFHSIRFPLDHPTCDDFQKLAHPSQTLYRQLSRMVQLITSFQTKPLFFSQKRTGS